GHQVGHEARRAAGFQYRRLSGCDRRDRGRRAHRDGRCPSSQGRPKGPTRTGSDAVNSFNLSDWALRHRSLVWYFMIAFMAAGLFSYLKLGREEDPSFTIKTMLIQAKWPGASAEETTRQVTERIEKKLEELESL